MGKETGRRPTPEDRSRDTIRHVRHRAILATLLIGAAVATQAGWAQDSSGITGAVFTNPGARSIGLGGAFAAIADDASAAFANPAGLVQIVRPEISVELRGKASRSDTGSPYELANDVSGLGFFSFVYPFRDWALALYSHQFASVGFTITEPIPVFREFTVRSFAASAAYEVGDRLSLGFGLSYFDGDRTAGAGVTEISDADWGLSAGVLWKPSPAWRFAGFYRQGPEFEGRVASTRLTLPNQYGVGAAFQPKAGALTIGFEWDRVGSTVDPLLTGSAVTEGGSEYHLGAEYAVLRWKPVPAIRVGFWRESGYRHNVVNGFGVEESFRSEGGTHMAFGLGLAFKRFQIDVGADVSHRAVVGSASFVYSF